MKPKRGHRSGSVYQRSSDQRWVAQVTLAGHHQMAYFHSQAEAQRWLSFALLQIHQKKSISTTQLPLSVYLETWLEQMALGLRLKTLIQYRQVITHHILPELGDLLIQELRPAQIQSFYQLKAQAGMNPRLLQLVNCLLHHALEDATRSSLIPVNPVQSTLKPKRSYVERKVLQPSQVQQLLKACQGTRWEALFSLAVTTGMREGELLGLKWTDIHWDQGVVQIQRQLYRVPGQGLVFNPPKTPTSRRNVALGPRMLEQLQEHAKRQQEEKERAGEKWQENGLVFPTSLGTPTDPHRLYTYYKVLLQKLGLPDLRFHDLRHTAATLMLSGGIHPKVAQERLGHARISYTLGTYSHVLPTIQEEAAQRMDQLIFTDSKQKPEDRLS